MPTENRSSNTEMVSVPLELLKRCVQPVCETEDWDKLKNIAAQPAEQHQGEPVAYQFQGRDGKWYGFTNERHYQNTLTDGTWPIRPLYTHPALAGYGEVERLVAANTEFAHRHLELNGEVERLQFELSEARALANGQTSLRKEDAEAWAKERDTLRTLSETAADQVVSLLAQLRDANDKLTERDALLLDISNAYWRNDAEMPYALVERIKALSASAEPSAPAERDERAEFEASHVELFGCLPRTDDQQPDFALSHYNRWLLWQARAALERKP